LNINDKIGKWFPQYPMWKKVTIKQLLNMTSGIPDYGSPEFFAYLKKNLTAEYDDKFLLSFAKPNQPIVSGKKFEYSNSNYILAGMIIESVTGKSFSDVINSRIIIPLNLHDTYYAAGPNWRQINEIAFPRKAHGYLIEDGSMVEITDVNLSCGGPAGAIVSTTEDQLKWVDALYHGNIFTRQSRNKSLKALKSVVSMSTGQPIPTVNKTHPFGFGLGVGLLYDKKQRFWNYEGGKVDFRMMYVWKPCTNISVNVSLNSNNLETGNNSQVKDHIKDLVLAIYRKVAENKNINRANHCAEDAV
jgi:D-alanyl-D-alanine carboxypeptidase